MQNAMCTLIFSLNKCKLYNLYRYIRRCVTKSCLNPKSRNLNRKKSQRRVGGQPGSKYKRERLCEFRIFMSMRRDYLQRSKLLSEKANSVQGQKSNCRLLNKAFEDFHFKMSPGKLELGGINFLKVWNDLIFSFYRPSVTMKPAQIWFSQNGKKLLEEVIKHVVTIIFWVNIQFNIIM